MDDTAATIAGEPSGAGEDRRAGRGFTRVDAVRAALNPYESPRRAGTLVEFAGLPAAAAAELFGALPPWQAEQRRTGAPSAAELLELRRGCPDLTFSGYRVPSEREDEPFALAGLQAPLTLALDEALQMLLERYPPDQLAVVDAAQDDEYLEEEILSHADLERLVAAERAAPRAGRMLAAWWDY